MAYTVDTTPNPAGRYSVRDSSGRVVYNASSPQIAQQQAQRLESRDAQIAASKPTPQSVTSQQASSNTSQTSQTQQTSDLTGDPRRVTDSRTNMQATGLEFNDAQTQQQQQTQYNSVEEYIQAETNRILADSNTFNDDEVVNVIYDRGYRAVTKNGEMGARRDTREEAIASAEKSFQIGQKVAETAEQRAQLLQLATKAKHFGGNSVNMRQLTDLVYQAIPEAGRTEAFFTAGNIRPAVSYNKRGQVYTSYGKELDIVLEKIKNRDDYRFVIVSPEGVKLTTTSLDPKDLIGFGLDTNKIKSAIDNYKQIKPNGVLPGNSNILYDAISNNLSGSDYLSRLQEQSKRPGGATISTDGGPARTITQEKTGRYKGFGFYPGMADTFQDEKQFLNNVYTSINSTLAGALLYGAVVDTADFRPSYTQESYLQTLNQAYGTPNNNITFGPEGLQYTFADGYSTVWGQQLNRLDALSAMIGVQINSPTQGKMFKDAQNFNTLEDYDAWKSTQEPIEEPVTTATTTPQIEEPTPPGGTPPVDDQTYPEYTAPQGLGGGEQYTGTGATVGGYPGSTQESIQAGQQMYGTLPFQYTPTSTYTVGAGGVTGQTQQQQPQQYTVRQFRNASGLSTSITFVDGKPITPIPSGFYPVDSQPISMGVQPAMVQAPTFAETPMPQATQQAATGQAQVAPIPASSQIVPFETQQQQAQQTMGTPSGYMPNFTGQPVTYQMATGGSVPAQTTATSTQPVGEFAGFRPEALQRIANTVGYQGDMNGFNAYLQNNPAANEQMTYFMNAARKMAKGGLLKAQDGVDTTGAVAAGNATKVMPTVLNQQYIPQQNFPTGANLPQVQAEIAKTPGLPTGATVVPVGTTLEAGQLVSPYSGQVSGSVALPTAQAATTAAAMPTQQQATLTSAIEATPAVNSALQSLQAAQGTIDPRAQVLAAQQTASSVGDLQAAQGNAILMDNPIQRQIQDGELISGVANAETASAYTEQLQAAQATPSEQATVQGQLEGLMAQFEGGNTPAWAAGSMRKAMSTLAARGLGASSMAGQAVIQAAMEAALPIAQIDAATQSQFEQMNLSNRQQRVMLAAQQRAAFLGIEFDQAFQARVANAAKISDIANTNFTTEVQVALENSRIANTMNLQNLNNNQALVMAEAAALSQLDMQNLNNRQQAAVQNAQNFLTMDMANLSNQQQTDLFKAQQRVQSLFTDQAAQNAAQQFNASSENQVNQFFANLAQQTAQFNATQANAQAQFNAGQINTIERFNAEINNQRDQFNAQNRLIIDQSNAQWRREIATADSAAVNRANELNATALIGLSQSAYNNLWQYYRDNMEWAWTSAENERQRITNIAIAQLQADSSKSIQEMKQDYQSSANMGAAVFKVLTSDLSNSILGNLFG